MTVRTLNLIQDISFAHQVVCVALIIAFFKKISDTSQHLSKQEMMTGL